MPDKEEKRQEVDQFRVGEEKYVGAGEDVLFQIIRTTTLMFKFGCELLLLFSSFHVYKWAIFWSLPGHAFSLFSIG